PQGLRRRVQSLDPLQRPGQIKEFPVPLSGSVGQRLRYRYFYALFLRFTHAMCGCCCVGVFSLFLGNRGEKRRGRGREQPLRLGIKGGEGGGGQGDEPAVGWA